MVDNSEKPGPVLYENDTDTCPFLRQWRWTALRFRQMIALADNAADIAQIRYCQDKRYLNDLLDGWVFPETMQRLSARLLASGNATWRANV